MIRASQNTTRQSSLKWGLGGLGALGAGLAACSLVCSIVVPALLALGAGAAALSAIEAGAEVSGKLLVAGGLLAIAFAAVRWVRQCRDCRCKDTTTSAAEIVDPPPRDEPIACTLDGRGALQRLVEFRGAFERGYIGGERTDVGVRWRFRSVPGLEDELRSLAEKEQQCCRFFRFEIRAAGEEIWWDTRVANPEARPILEEFFDLPCQVGRPDQAPCDAEPTFWPGHGQPKAERG
ncbi:MAG TPA: hypothetical protein VHC69_27860 [Polyangiaceae bacterium]|nr:hypothetical protein [Polyangiaceae bacterium]